MAQSSFRPRPGTIITTTRNGVRIVRQDSEWKLRRDRENAARALARSIQDSPLVKRAILDDWDRDARGFTLFVEFSGAERVADLDRWTVAGDAVTLRRVRRVVDREVRQVGGAVARYVQPTRSRRFAEYDAPHAIVDIVL